MERQKANRRRGGSMVEFAVTMPLLLLMTVAASDFSRIFWESIVMSRAAETGAKYGAESHQSSSKYADMQRVASNSSSHIANATPTAERLCDCPDAPGSWIDCLNTQCPNYGTPRAYARVSVTKTFSTMGYYPGLQRDTNMTWRGYMRVQ